MSGFAFCYFNINLEKFYSSLKLSCCGKTHSDPDYSATTVIIVVFIKDWEIVSYIYGGITEQII